MLLSSVMDRKTFEKLVVQALNELPQEFRARLENVEIVVGETSPRSSSGKEVILGLYTGIPLKRRGRWYHAALPDKITIYKDMIERICNNERDIKKKIYDVLYHEIGHHFGLKEEDL